MPVALPALFHALAGIKPPSRHGIIAEQYDGTASLHQVRGFVPGIATQYLQFRIIQFVSTVGHSKTERSMESNS